MSTLTEEVAGLLLDSGDLTGDATALFSPCRRYRYALTRVWDRRLPDAVWVMLNPSTADAFRLDRTLTRCRSFSRAAGYGGMVILNLFALRATDPDVMRAHPDPVGVDNDRVIADFAESESDALWVAGWGIHGVHRGRAGAVESMLRARGVSLTALGVTKGGHPRHPLYMRGDSVPVPL